MQETIEHTLQRTCTMASHHPRRDDNPSVFTSETPHFFKVILQRDIQHGILEIPRRFVRIYGNQLPSIVKLEVPSGESTWTVKLEKTDGRVILQKGWREFAEYYSLEVGSFVVFRSEGNGHFHVLILEKTATDIEYTSTEDFPCPFTHKKTRTDSEYERVHRSADGVGVTSPRSSAKTEVFSCSQKLRRAEKAQATQRASAFKSRKNPDFMVVMQPSYLRNQYRMGVPSDFAKKYMQMQTCDLNLSDSCGKTWPVKYYSNAPEHSDQLQAHIRDGWKAFVEDNDLAVGDICVFQLIKQQPEIMMKVVIMRKIENASKGCR